MKLVTKAKKALKLYDDANNFTCDICGREVFGGERVCAPCLKALPKNDGLICPHCGRKVREAGVCIECKEKPLGVEKARSVFLHEGEAMRLVVRFKCGEKYLFRTLASLSLPLVEREFPDVDALLGVPMTEKAQKKRGFNQAVLFAECLAEKLNKPLITPIVKCKETEMQKLLARRDRESNLEGSFQVTMPGEVKGRRILIVDDTITTGATVSALADAVKRAGAEKVYAFTFTSVENRYSHGKPPKA